MTALTRWNPFEDMSRLWPRDLFDREFFSRVGPDGGLSFEWSPRCDITESGDEIVVKAEVPGVPAKDIEMSIAGGVLTLRGEKRSETTEEKEGRSYKERFFGSFERSLALPKTVDESKIDARLKDGVLEVHLPKVKAPKADEQKIPIKAG